MTPHPSLCVCARAHVAVPLGLSGSQCCGLLQVPLSVVMVAAAIQRVANVPLKNR